MILQVGRGIFGDFFFGRCYPCTKYAWLSTNQEGVLLVFTFKVNSLHKNLTYFLMQQFYQQTARRAETSSTMYISGKPQQTNPQKYGPLDECGGAYMLRYSEQTRVNLPKIYWNSNQINCVHGVKTTLSFLFCKPTTLHQDNFHCF